jgi:hypothetical protein
MKKIFMTVALLSLFAFIVPKTATSDDNGCWTKIIYCDDGTQHLALVCDYQDWLTWHELLCGYVPGG